MRHSHSHRSRQLAARWSPLGPTRAKHLGAIAFALLLMAAPARSQTVTEIRLTADDIAAGRAVCTVTRRPPATSGSPSSTDSLIVSVFKDATYKEPALSPAALEVIRRNASLRSLALGFSRDSQSLPTNELAGAWIVVRRFDSARRLCSDGAPPPNVGGARPGLRSTAFVAEGAVSTALRTDGTNGTATGALGIDHLDIKTEAQRRHFLGIKKLRLKSERLRALIAVASTVDTLVDNSRTIFRRAVLAPGQAGKGTLGSAMVEYQPSMKMFDGSQGPRLNLTFARTTWRITNRDSVVPGVRRDTAFADNLTIGSFDGRWRFQFIEQTRDSEGNDFAFGVEAGYTMRWLAGDGASDDAFKMATLGTNQNVFHGLAGGLYIRLRHVTAFADLPYLFSRSGTLKGLKGLQPLLTINVGAPLFIFSGRSEGEPTLDNQ